MPSIAEALFQNLTYSTGVQVGDGTLTLTYETDPDCSSSEPVAPAPAVPAPAVPAQPSAVEPTVTG